MTIENIDRHPRFRNQGPNVGDELAGGAGPPHDGGMEPRIAKLEATVEYMQRDLKELRDDVKAVRGDITSIRTTDFRILFGAIITVALGLAALMAHGFKWI